MASTVDPHLRRATPGRARVHVPGLSAHDAPAIETTLRRVPGVRAVEAHPLTSNVLVLYDRHVTNDGAILDAARAFAPGMPHGTGQDVTPTASEEQQAPSTAYTRSPRVISSGRGSATRARIAVRGLDRDPDLARRVVARLERRPGVHARANPLTGRVLVEFDARQTDIRALLSDVGDVERTDVRDDETMTPPRVPTTPGQGAARGRALRAARLVGAVMKEPAGARDGTGPRRVARPLSVVLRAALTGGWARLRGGTPARSALAPLVDPRPERWGRQSPDEVLRALDTTVGGLTTRQAVERRRELPPQATRDSKFLTALLAQLASPLTAVLGAGAALSLVLGAPADVALIGAVLVANAAVGAWQERRADQVAAALAHMSAPTARVLRDGAATTVAAADVVPGDILLLAAGNRVAADARLLAARYLEVDEATLTGESLPVPKAPDGATDESRIVLEGSDITVGTGRAVVVAVGRDTRLGSIAAALQTEGPPQSPLNARLAAMLRQTLPVIAAGGAIVAGAGVLRGAPLLPQLALGASLAIAAVPESLPLFAALGQAAVARRLAGRHALVRRLGAVEALGRVDVACTDKTGTLTQGRLALTDVADLDRDDHLWAGPLPDGLRDVLLAAGLASPHPDAADAAAHPTDVAVVAGARAAGLGDALCVERTAEAPFDPDRAFHAAIVGDRLCVKGAAEALTPRCASVRRGGVDRPLDEAGRETLRARAAALAARGLRVLMVAAGPVPVSTDDPAGRAAWGADPHGLVALGFVGISDPLRPAVPAAVRRCHAAGVRVLMLTGDHPATARAIARDAGLRDGGDVLTGAVIAALGDGDLDRRLEGVTIVARVTPLDKLHIVESLQRHGHVVAMTGDGVNDAPALRLADVGVAMGRGGTEVARQAADVVLADDDFATLVEALVEGRSFWYNIRRALGLFLGGNLGELGFVVGASVIGLVSPLTLRQILAVNLITDVLPAVAVALQQPESRDLGVLAREGEGALGAPLRADIMRRAVATAVPTLAAYLIALRAGSLPAARAVAFGSIVTTQLAQTLDLGRDGRGGVSRPVAGAVAGSGAMLAAALTVPALREVFALAAPTPLGWALIAAGAPLAVLLSRLLERSGGSEDAAPALASPSPRLLPAPGASC